MVFFYLAGLEVNRDGSSSFNLSPGSYIKVKTNLLGVGGKQLNDYTLTMDVMFEQLPGESAALFQSGCMF
jgi:hypothetical protein